MNIQMTAGEALQAFCRAWFVERDVEAAMAFIREDVDFVGTGIGESAASGLLCVGKTVCRNNAPSRIVPLSADGSSG